MFKKIKSLFKNKKGDFAIYALIVIPALITIFTTVITSNYKKTIINSKYQTELDNLSLIASKYYTQTYETAGNDDFAIDFIESDIFGKRTDSNYEEGFYYKNDGTLVNWAEEVKGEKIVARGILKPTMNITNMDESFAKYCSLFLKNIDGVNDFWRLDIQIIKINGSDSETLKLQLFYALPNLHVNRAISNYGYSIGNNENGWYKNNKYTWSDLKSGIENKGVINADGKYVAPNGNNLICKKTVVYSTKQ